MLTTYARRARQAGGWAALACAALLVTACSSSSSSAAAASSPASALATSSSSTSSAGSASPSGPASAPASPSTSPSVTTSAAGASTYLAQAQDINGTVLYRPACNSGCPLSGDSTAILDKMTWSTWSATEAVGAGIYELDGCNPSCAAGPIYSVATVVTLSDPVKVCSSSGPAGSGPAPRSVSQRPAQGAAGRQRAGEPLGLLHRGLRRPAELRQLAQPPRLQRHRCSIVVARTTTMFHRCDWLARAR